MTDLENGKLGRQNRVKETPLEDWVLVFCQDVLQEHLQLAGKCVCV